MNRIQKKCVIASTGFHLSLALILLVGPGFLSSHKKSDDRPPSEFIPAKTIDELFSNPGGNPSPAPAPVQPVTPAPAVVRPPEPVTPPRRDTPETPETKPARSLPEVSLTPVVRRTDKQKSKQKHDNDSARDAARERANQFASVARSVAGHLKSGLSSATEIELGTGAGSGVSYANFLDSLKKIYSDNWIVPDGVTDDEAAAKARVTIARDGRVVSWKMIRPSGNSLVDASVEMVLRRTTKTVPLPDSAKEDERTVTITFSVKAKRGLG